MTTIKQLELPKKYNYIEGVSDPKYKKFDKKPKLSYSAFNSFKEEGYRGEFFSNYFLGLPNNGNIFTFFGSACGDYWSELKENELLSDFDKKVIIEKVGRIEGAQYEREILVDRGSYCISGFIDRTIIENNVVDLRDMKTGSIEKKKKEYESDKYTQVDLYCYALDTEGLEIGYSGVILLDRKGHGRTVEHPLRLTGDIAYIDKPYSRLKTEQTLKEFDEIAAEIQEYYRIFNKYLK